MRTIKYFNKEISVDEFIKQQIIRNDGTRSLVYKHKLVEECEKRNIKTAVTSTKEQLTELLADSGMSYKELADRYGIGVTIKNYQEAFGITHKQVKKLEKKGILKVVGNYEFRAYGRVLKAPLYDAYQFAMIADETVKEIWKDGIVNMAHHDKVKKTLENRRKLREVIHMKNKINKAMKVLKVVLNIFMWTCGMVFILFLFYDTDSEETAMLIHSTFGYFITFLIIYALYRMANRYYE